MAASGAPAIGVALAIVGHGDLRPLGLCAGRRRCRGSRRLVPSRWRWARRCRLGLASPAALAEPAHHPRLLLWFGWPAWPLALWTLWRWRGHLLHRHIAVPLGMPRWRHRRLPAMGGSDRALMLALPSLAVLAAFALPTLHRSTSAAIDWFSVIFFSWRAGDLGHLRRRCRPACRPNRRPTWRARRRVRTRASVGLALRIAIAGTLAWIVAGALAHRAAPPSAVEEPGAAGPAAWLCWLLLMTLWLPLLDHARSRPLLRASPSWCPRLPASPRRSAARAAGRAGGDGPLLVDAITPAGDGPAGSSCAPATKQPAPRRSKAGSRWRVQRPTDRNDFIAGLPARLTLAQLAR